MNGVSKEAEITRRDQKPPDTMPGQSTNAVGDINYARQNSANSFSAEQEKRHRVLKRALSVGEPPKKSCCRGNCLTTFSSFIVSTLEKAFFSLGRFVGTFPVLTIVMCVLLTLLTALGLKTFTASTDDDTIWVPTGSRLLNEKKFAENAFPAETRYVTVLTVHDDNVLTPTFITAMFDYYEYSLSITANGKKFSDLCVRIGSQCSVTSLLELWNYDGSVIRALTQTDILTAINNTRTTPLSGVEVETLLGGRLVFENGAIKSAGATQLTWTMRKEENENAAKEFEQLMIDYAQKGHRQISQTYVYASRSFEDEGLGALNSDVNRLAAGFIIVFIYILFGLGRFNLMEQKVYLSIAGMLSVIFSIVAAYGIGTALSIVYSPLQTIMPFLLLGIGVDDMFVIVEAWKNLSPEEFEFSVPDKISICIARAGMSITVTSVTDIVAFGIGASTVIPALGSFCLYSAIGILALFFLVCTFFVAVLALDERRRKQRRDGCIVCYKHSDSYRPNKWSTGQSFFQIFFSKYYGPFLSHKAVKAIVILVSLVMVSLGAWRFAQIEEDFDSVNYIPSDSYAYEYQRARERLFNRQGIATRVYCASFNYLEYRDELDGMYNEMNTASLIIQTGTINSWFTSYHDHLTSTGTTVTTEQQYNDQLFAYIQGVGDKFKSFVNFNATSTPVSILASHITATHVRGGDAKQSISIMDDLRKIIDSAGFPKFSGGGKPEYKCFAYSPEYMALETNKVLGEELMRNLILAAVAVLIMTIVLVANIPCSIMVFFCVSFTVVDVGGVLELWGTTIDTASSVLLTLSVGLAVDYSAHVAHTYMTVEGTKEERAIHTLTEIGPAVLNGGVSTLLAFILLADSASYGFRLFFRVFLSVVLFGMFHGLCLLPVLLSMFGPLSYKAAREKADKNFFSQAGQINNQTEMPDKFHDNNRQVAQQGYDGPFSKLHNGKDEPISSPTGSGHFSPQTGNVPEGYKRDGNYHSAPESTEGLAPVSNSHVTTVL